MGLHSWLARFISTSLKYTASARTSVKNHTKVNFKELLSENLLHEPLLIPVFVHLVPELKVWLIFDSDVHLQNGRDNSLDLRCQERTRVTRQISPPPSTMPCLPFISVTCWTHGHDMTTHMLWAWTPRRWSHAHHMIMTCQSQACTPSFKLPSTILVTRPTAQHSLGY